MYVDWVSGFPPLKGMTGYQCLYVIYWEWSTSHQRERWRRFYEILSTTNIVHTSFVLRIEMANAIEQIRFWTIRSGRPQMWSVSKGLVQHLMLAEFAMNTVKHSGIDMRPFHLIHEHEPNWSDTFNQPVRNWMYRLLRHPARVASTYLMCDCVH